MSDELSALDKILEALRRSRNETQLTQIVAAFAGSDSKFAGCLAKAFVTESPTASGLDQSQMNSAAGPRAI